MQRTALILCIAMTGCAATSSGRSAQGVLLGVGIAAAAFAENVNSQHEVARNTEKPGAQFTVISGVALLAAIAIGILDRPATPVDPEPIARASTFGSGR